MLARCTVHGVVRQEVHTCPHDVLRGGEVLLAECSLGLQSDLERAEAVELHHLRGIEVTVHHVDEFDEHAHHIRILHGDILLNLFANLLQVDGASVHGTSKPLALGEALLAVVLVSTINYSHCFSFLLAPSDLPQ